MLKDARLKPFDHLVLVVEVRPLGKIKSWGFTHLFFGDIMEYLSFHGYAGAGARLVTLAELEVQTLNLGLGELHGQPNKKPQFWMEKTTGEMGDGYGNGRKLTVASPGCIYYTPHENHLCRLVSNAFIRTQYVATQFPKPLFDISFSGKLFLVPPFGLDASFSFGIPQPCHTEGY
jgi:hypothetical protein